MCGVSAPPAVAKRHRRCRHLWAANTKLDRGGLRGQVCVLCMAIRIVKA